MSDPNTVAVKGGSDDFGTIRLPNPTENGDLHTRTPGGDEVRLHISRFHGVIVCASRTYMNEATAREVCAYLGDPQLVANWLGAWGYVAEEEAVSA